jgi:hypothetical protein
MPSCGRLRRVTPVRTNVLEERSAYINRLIRIGELGTTLAVTSNRRKLSASVTANVVPSSPTLVTKYFIAAFVGCYLQLALFLVHRVLLPLSLFLRNVGSYKSHTG